MDAQGEQYGLHRLADAIRRHSAEPADTLVNTVLSDVTRFASEGPTGDDCLLVVLRVE